MLVTVAVSLVVDLVVLVGEAPVPIPIETLIQVDVQILLDALIQADDQTPVDLLLDLTVEDPNQRAPQHIVKEKIN